jgi:opacity protein-like surface antigen
MDSIRSTKPALGTIALRFGIAGLLAGPAGLFAQAGAPPDDTGELSVYTGAVFGSPGGHSVAGAATGLYMSKYVVALIDASFTPLGDNILRHHPEVAADSRLYDINFAVHIRVPAGRRLAPYGLAGAALLYNTYQIRSMQPESDASLSGQNYVRFGFETGGGARYYIGDSWGVRGEYRYTLSTHNFSGISVGVFYQFSGSWPFLNRHETGH